MQILHLFAGSTQQYSEEIYDPDRHQPDHCPQCAAQRPLTAHGFDSRTVTDVEFAGFIRLRRYLCRCCKRTVSLLPEFALPYLRFSILVISLFLVARLWNGCTLQAAAQAAAQPRLSRGQDKGMGREYANRGHQQPGQERNRNRRPQAIIVSPESVIKPQYNALPSLGGRCGNLIEADPFRGPAPRNAGSVSAKPAQTALAPVLRLSSC